MQETYTFNRHARAACDHPDVCISGVTYLQNVLS